MSQVEYERNARLQEVSLIDLLVVFVRYKKVFAAAFVALAILVSIVAYIAPSKYRYVTLVQLAEEGRGEPIEVPQSVYTWMVTQVVPSIEAEYESRYSGDMPFEIAIEVPADTTLIKISSEAGEPLSSRVEVVHTQLTGELMARQETQVNRLLDALSNQMKSVDRSVEQLGELTDAGAGLARVIERKAELEKSIQEMKSAELLSTSQRSVKAVSKGPVFILALGLIVSAILAALITLTWAAFSYANKQAKVVVGK